MAVVFARNVIPSVFEQHDINIGISRKSLLLLSIIVNLSWLSEAFALVNAMLLKEGFDLHVEN